MESIELDPLTEFYESIRNVLPRQKYERWLALLLEKIKVDDKNLKEQARNFDSISEKDPKWATYKINEYMQSQKERAEREEICESTAHNFFKPIKFTEVGSKKHFNDRISVRKVPDLEKWFPDIAAGETGFVGQRIYD